MDVKTLCLGALDAADATGYEIKKMFEDGVFSHFLEASFGSIYPALTRLTEEGLLTCKSQPQDGRPDKKTYSITKAGRATLLETLEQPIAADRYKSEFLFAMQFASVLTPERVTTLIEHRLRETRSELAKIKAEECAGVTPGQEFVRLYGETLMQATIEFIEKNRHFIENSPVKKKLEPAR